MGLDNSFVVKNVSRENIPYWVKLPFDFDMDDGGFEIAYFRKYWGLRNEILTKLHCLSRNDVQTPVEYDDILPIVKILMKYLDEKHYEENADSIWEFCEARENIQQSIINLMWLKMYMDTHPDVECYFYDSY